MIKILAIGNSFSQDAVYYLHDIAACDDIHIKVVNLYIGGCSLETHWKNAEKDGSLYQYELNGRTTGRYVSIKEVLMEESWNFVTMQQVSGDSGIIETYYPYIKYLSEYISAFVPYAEQIIHQTWAYENDSDHEAFVKYYNNQKIMYNSLVQAYNIAAGDLGLKIIPCGEVIQKLRETDEFNYQKGGLSLCRDGYHLSLNFGRYAAAATWYQTITGNNILNNSFIPPDVSKDRYKYLDTIKKIVCDVCL